MKALSWSRTFIAISLTAFVSGCGDSRYELAPVSGTVTVDGNPVADALVGFEPKAKGADGLAGPGSYARTDAAGHYRLEAVNGSRGAVVGEHLVSITTLQLDEDEDGNPVEAVAEVIPQRYHEPDALTFTVPAEGTDAADFSLTTDP